MPPRATSIRRGRGDQPRWPTQACQQWREQCLRTGLRPGSTSQSSLPPLCGVTMERASRHRADTRNPPKGQTFTPFDDGPSRSSSIDGPHEPRARPFRGSSSWVLHGGPPHDPPCTGTPLNRARALRRLTLFSDATATADGIVAWLRMSERANRGARCRCSVETAARRRKGSIDPPIQPSFHRLHRDCIHLFASAERACVFGDVEVLPHAGSERVLFT
jgi:hypothetical protein